MMIHTAGERSLALFFDDGELIAREEDDENAISRVRQIAKEAFLKRGIDAKNFEIQAYEGKTGTVVFVFAEENACRLLFSFEDITHAAEAAKRLGDFLPIDSKLTELDGRCYMLLHIREDAHSRVQWALCEYGKQEEGGDVFLAHLDEMGRTVMRHHATRLLARFW